MNFRFLLVLLVTLLFGTSALAYDGSVHKQITQAAVKAFNDCLASDPSLPAGYAISDAGLVKDVVKANRNEDGTLLTYPVRLGNWHFYNTNNVPNTGWPKHFLDVIFDKKVASLKEAVEEQQSVAKLYRKAGKVMHYIQDVSSPPHVVPVYHWKFLGMGIKEPFDSYEVDLKKFQELLTPSADQCKDLLAGDIDFDVLMSKDAQATFDMMSKPIPVTNAAGEEPYKWAAFWRPAGSAEPACSDRKAKEGFGSYGRFCNQFGEKSPLPEQAEPIEIPSSVYDDFFMTQFLQARNSSVKVLAWTMRQNLAQAGRAQTLVGMAEK